MSEPTDNSFLVTLDKAFCAVGAKIVDKPATAISEPDQWKSYIELWRSIVENDESE